MTKLSNKEKRILKFIITNCELYHLNETEAMIYIQHNFNGSISRRTYYNYKNGIYRDYEKSSTYSETLRRMHPQMFRKYCNLFLASDKIEMLRSGLEEKIRLEKYDRLTFVPKYLKVFQARMVTSIESLEKSIYELKSEKETVNRNLLSIPNNASVREEFIKCGKISCSSCPHGPYYYAYWKYNGELRKKYVGTDQIFLNRTKRSNYH